MQFKRVYAVTPNPALDVNGVVAQIVENEKNYVLHEERYAGGNAVNSAQVLTHLAVPVRASGFLGGAIGAQINALLKKDGVDTDFVEIRNESRINVTISGQHSRQQTRFSFIGPRLRSEEKAQLRKKLSQQNSTTLLMLSGSFPPNFTLKDALEIIAEAHRKQIACIVDVPASHLRAILTARPLMIKPNLAEFEELTGRKLRQIPEIVSAVQPFLKQCPVICISSVQDGTLLFVRGAIFFATGPKVSIKSTVGAGDSMVGAMAAEMINQKLSYDLLFDESANIPPKVWKAVLALGMGAALATIALPGTCIGKKQEIQLYANKIRVRQLGGQVRGSS